MEYMMTERPAFEELSSYKEFQKYYWYRAELVEICKSIGVDHTGVKTELNHNIAEYFKGNRIKKVSRSVSSVSSDTITLDTPLLGCKFSFNANGYIFHRWQGLYRLSLQRIWRRHGGEWRRCRTRRLPYATCWRYTREIMPMRHTAHLRVNGINS